MTRRHLLLGTGAGVTGVALGAASSSVGLDLVPPTAYASTFRDAQMREDDGAAGPYGEPSRLGIQRVIWSTQPDGAYAAISFDDGPDPEFTPRILKALADANVRATFFAMGYNANRHPQLIRDILAEGHEIGNHTWSHLDQTGVHAATIRDEIVRAKDQLERLTGSPLMGFRPPRGELTGYAQRACAEFGYDTYIWSLERGPSGTSTPAAVTAHLVKNVQPGDIIDLHDGIGRGTFSPHSAGSHALAARREVEVHALPTVLKEIKAKGITLTSCTDLMSRSTPPRSAMP